MAEDTNRGGDRSPSARLKRSWLLGVHLVVVGVAVSALLSGLDPRPEGDSQRRVTPCVLVRADDSLSQLAKRWPRKNVIAQLERSTACDPEAIHAMKRAVERDYRLTAAIGTAFVIAAVSVRKKRRWRLAVGIGSAFAVGYVVCDLLENRQLLELLRAFEDGKDDPDIVPNTLRWVAAMKLGAFIAGAPMLFASLAMAIDHLLYGIGGDRDFGGDQWGRMKRFAQRWYNRLSKPGTRMVAGAPNYFVTTVESAQTVGICASGGGIRSAAFNLGAFQAFPEGEMGRVRWVTAVSGGSYMAAAWVRHGAAAWGRGSARESHLRRNASYLAPGLGGKLWALARFLFGFGLNLGVVILALGAVFVPYGWGVERLQEPRPLTGAGTIELPKGGCLERPDGTFTLADAGETVAVGARSSTRVDMTTAPEIPKDKAAPESRVKVTVDGQRVDVTVETIPSSSSTPASSTTTTTTEKGVLEADCAALTEDNEGGDTSAVSSEDTPDELPLRKGWKLRLDLTEAVPLAAGQVNGCVAKSKCEKAVVVDVQQGTRLVAAPDATLALAKDAVAVRGDLAARCGRTHCQRWGGHPALTITFGAVAGLALLAGVALVLTRLEGQIAVAAEHWTRRLVVITLLVGAFGLLLPALVSWSEGQRHTLEADLVPTAGAGSSAILIALLARLASFAGSSESTAAPAGKVTSLLKSGARKVQPLLIRVAAYVAGPLLLGAITLLFAADAATNSFRPSQLTMWLGIVGAVAITFAVGDLNEWSLHPFYRERLKSAFAADPVTLKCHPDKLSDLPRSKPELIVCAAANIADARLTAPGRPVTSWVFTASQVGSAALGDLEGSEGTFEPARLPESLRHLDSLWNAVAVSGAAFAPAMGKMTRAERMLLTLGNLRLGQWYPNPRYLRPAAPHRGYDLDWYKHHYPRPWYLAKEAVGLHRADDPWVYVTDGGHYENLGLVELLRRRCREIYCFDAAGDSPDTFGTLADAIRIARQELSVEIKIDPTVLKPDKDGFSKRGTWLASVHYPGGVEGWLVVAKLSVPESAPFDIKDLARTLPSFPTHPTADQLYTDQKFEAYRALGHHLGSDAVQLAAKVQQKMAGPPTINAGAAVAAVIDDLRPPKEPPDRLDVKLIPDRDA